MGIRPPWETRQLTPGLISSLPGAAGLPPVTMTYVIAEPCIDVKDKACVEVCPVDCIYEGEKEGFPDMLYIHPDECIDCGVCQPECPVDAIFPEDDVPEEWNNYIQINYDYFK